MPALRLFAGFGIKCFENHVSDNSSGGACVKVAVSYLRHTPGSGVVKPCVRSFSLRPVVHPPYGLRGCARGLLVLPGGSRL